jgi:hypothetical protein
MSRSYTPLPLAACMAVAGQLSLVARKKIIMRMCWARLRKKNNLSSEHVLRTVQIALKEILWEYTEFI